MAAIELFLKTQGGALEARWPESGVFVSGDVCEPLSLAGSNDKTATIIGTATTFALQGSNDGATWFTLHNIDNADTPITATGIWLIKENPLFIRPFLTTGSLVVSLSCV